MRPSRMNVIAAMRVSRRVGKASFPLTPALSPRAREFGIRSGRRFNTLGPDLDSIASTNTPSATPPLLGGDGRGEGEGGPKHESGSILFPAPSLRRFGLRTIVSLEAGCGSFPLTPTLSSRESGLGIPSRA